MEEKSMAARRKEELFEQPKNAWSIVTSTIPRNEPLSFARAIRPFLICRRQSVRPVRRQYELAETAGFVEYDREAVYQPGDRVYRCNRGKSVIFAVIGREPISKGIRIAAAHIDSPRLDLKQHPLYEDSELAYFKTHYYRRNP